MASSNVLFSNHAPLFPFLRPSVPVPVCRLSVPSVQESRVPVCPHPALSTGLQIYANPQVWAAGGALYAYSTQFRGCDPTRACCCWWASGKSQSVSPFKIIQLSLYNSTTKFILQLRSGTLFKCLNGQTARLFKKSLLFTTLLLLMFGEGAKII